MDRIRVLVADTQMLFADALARALEILSEDLEVLGDRPSSGPEALEVMSRARPDVAVVDMWLEGMEGAALAATARGRGVPGKVIVLSWFHGAGDIENAAAAGVAGVVAKDADVGVLASAIRTAHEGPQAFFEIVAGHDAPEAPARTPDGSSAPRSGHADAWAALATLTPREVQILKMLSLGNSIDEIAEAMSLKRSTVQTHVRNTLRKTGTGSQLAAVAMARRYGLIPP